MEKISKLWFEANRIYVETDASKVYSRPLEAFPALFEATEEQRLDFCIGKYGDDIRWASLDEDIHITSLIQDCNEPDYGNELAGIFSRFPELNVSSVARRVGINKSLLTSGESCGLGFRGTEADACDCGFGA